MTDEDHNVFSTLLKKNIVIPVKQKFNEYSRQISGLEKKIRLLQFWLFVISAFLLANMIITAFLWMRMR